MSKPIAFPEANTNLIAEGCGDLPAYQGEEVTLTCWKLSWRERFAALLKGRVWMCVQGNQPPVWIYAGKQGEPLR